MTRMKRQGNSWQIAARVGALAALWFGVALPAAAENIFLAKQYSGCSTCHYSPTGGGLLTPYGRTLSKQEISTWGRSKTEPDAAEKAAGARWREEAFLAGLLDPAIKPLDLGILARPVHMHQSFGGQSRDRNFWMTAELQAAWRQSGWTAYGELGRETAAGKTRTIGYEYWIGHDPETGPGFRIGRFLPAYGIRDADHTAYIRRDLGFDRDSQVYALELSARGDHSLLQASVGPGRAESILHDDGQKAFTMTLRNQIDIGSRNVLVFSGMFKGDSRRQPRSWLGGISWGFSPTRRLVLWTELDTWVGKGFRGTPAYTLYHEASFEVIRGVWLKFSPQLRTELENVNAGAIRYALGIEAFPRTHWTVGATWYWDRDRTTDLVYRTFLLQLKIYL